MYIAIAVKAQRKKMKENKNTNVHKKTHRCETSKNKSALEYTVAYCILYSRTKICLYIMSMQSTHRWQNTKACIQLFFSSLFRLAITYPLRVNLIFFFSSLYNM